MSAPNQALQATYLPSLRYGKSAPELGRWTPKSERPQMRMLMVLFALLAPTISVAQPSQWADACKRSWDDGNAASAFTYCQKAANDGHPYSQYVLGNLYFEGIGVAKDTKRGADLWLKAAASGVPDAQHNVGRLYQKGIGVEQSYPKALEWYQKAAAQGDTFAMHNIGYFYEKGLLGTVDNKKAEEWYTKAAMKGLPNSQYNLAVMYYNGAQLPQDKIRAYAWILLASEAEYTPARNDRPVLDQNLSNQQKEAGKKLAATLVIK